MELFELLKQLKKIEPDATYTAISKRSILAHGQANANAGAFEGSVSHGWSAQRTFWKIIESAAAVALTGFFIMLLTGAFNGSVAPQYSAIDANALHAEAQAIDIQIQLSKLSYIAPSGTLVAAVPGKKPMTAAAPLSTTAAPSSGTEAATNTISIDDALQSLTQ